MALNNPKSTPHGFTLLEIIIVLFFMMLMVSLSGVYYANSLPGIRLNSAARELTAEIRRAGAMARVKNEKQTILLNLDRKTFGIVGARLRQLPDGVFMMLQHPLNGETTKGEAKMTFQPSGGSEGYTIVVYNHRSTRTIKMDPVVGAAVVR
ncbi:MAG: hypothetical protein R6W75_09730 [Smithellaceae bacterium]